MGNQEVVKARPEAKIAILQIDHRNNVHGFVTVGGIGKQEGFQYLEVSSDLVDGLKMRGVPNGYFKYLDGKIFLPRLRKLKLQYQKHLNSAKHWYKHSKIHDAIDIVGSLMLPHLLVSITSALVSSFIAFYVISIESGLKTEMSLSQFLTVFLPCLTIFVTLIGIYVTLRDSRLGNERQQKALVKPSISLANSGTPSGKPVHTRIILVPHFGDKNIYSQFVRSTIVVENVGLANARNVSFLYVNQDKEPMLYGFSIKSLKPESSVEIEMTVSTKYEEHQILVYSICENIYGDAVFHAHHFLPRTNGENAYHLRDRQIKEGSSEFKTLMKYPGVWS